MPFAPLIKNNVVVYNDKWEQTIVFTHGFGTDQNAWSQITPAFKGKHRIILYDNVGAGQSLPEAFSPNKYDTLSTYADDLIDLCNALHVKNAIMVAHSVGGMINILASIKNPSLFSKLVLIGASPRYLNDNDYIGGFDQASLNALYEAMATNYFAWVSGFSAAAMRNAERPELAASFAATLSAIRPDLAQSVARVIFQSDHRKELSKINIPTLLLQTKSDIAVPIEVARYLNQNIKNSTLQIIDAEGHFPHISAAEAVTKNIEIFLEN